MKIKLNPDSQIVSIIKEGLKRRAATVPAAEKKRMTPNVCAKNSKSRLPIQTLKAFVIVCSITKKRNRNIESRNKI